MKSDILNIVLGVHLRWHMIKRAGLNRIHHVIIIIVTIIITLIGTIVVVALTHSQRIGRIVHHHVHVDSRLTIVAHNCRRRRRLPLKL